MKIRKYPYGTLRKVARDLDISVHPIYHHLKGLKVKAGDKIEAELIKYSCDIVDDQSQNSFRWDLTNNLKKGDQLLIVEKCNVSPKVVSAVLNGTLKDNSGIIEVAELLAMYNLWTDRFAKEDSEVDKEILVQSYKNTHNGYYN